MKVCKSAIYIATDRRTAIEVSGKYGLRPASPASAVENYRKCCSRLWGLSTRGVWKVVRSAFAKMSQDASCRAACFGREGRRLSRLVESGLNKWCNK